jgi:hypothetical protein
MRVHTTYDLKKLKGKTLVIHPHLGVGDQIVLCGLVRFIASQLPKVVLVVKAGTEATVARMYSDLDNVVLYPVLGNQHDDAHTKKACAAHGTEEALRIGHENYNPGLETEKGWDCGQIFYHLTNVPYQHRWDGFWVQRDEEREEKLLRILNPTHEPFVFAHEDPARGFRIAFRDVPGHLTIRNHPGFCLMDYILLLSEAAEIHLMPSSFFCLIESLPKELIKAKLFCYQGIRNGGFGEMKHQWNMK